MIKCKYLLISTIVFMLLSCTKTVVREEISTVEKKIFLKSAKIYTADEKGLEKSKRIYNSTFEVPAIDYLWFELIVKNENTNQADAKVKIREEWFNQSNLLVSSYSRELNLPQGKNFLEFSAGFKKENDWQKGNYTLKLYANNKLLCTKQIELL